MTKGTPNGGINGTLANGLLTHWCFNDGSLADISGNEINLLGKATFGTDKDGNSNCALLETGQTKMMDAVYRENSEIICAKYNWTISFFIKFDNNDGNMVPICQGVYKTGGYYFQRNNGTLNFGIYNPGTEKNITTPSMDWTIWRNVIVTIGSSGIAEMYIDNIFAGTVNLSGTTVSSSFIIGRYYFNDTLQFSGKIDEFRIYNRKITELERAEINMMGVNYEVDVTPPTFNTINTSNTTSSSVNLNINCNEDATAYYKLYDRGATAPTPAELKAAHDKTISLTANNLITENITGLTALKDYDLYVIAEDTVGNLQALPTKIDFTTANIGKGTPNEGINGTLGNGLLAHYSFNDGSLQDMSGNGNDLVQVGNVYDATDKDGQIGQAKEITDIGGNYLKWEIKNLINGTENAVSMWVYIPDLAHSGAFFSIGYGGPYSTTPRLLLGQRDDVLDIIVNGIGSSTEITVGWHNIIYNDRKLYVDKVLQNYMYPLIMDGFLYLFTGYPIELVCKLDEVRVYNRVLTDDDNLSFGETTTGEVAEIFDMGVNYGTPIKPKISEIIFNIDFDKVHLGDLIKIKYLDIKSNGVSILNKNPIVKYWNNYDNTPKIFSKEGELFGNSMDLYFQIECDGYETSDVIRKDLKMMRIDGYQGGYSGGGSGGGLSNYAYHNNDNYKTSEARILIPLTNTSFISYKK